MLQLRLLKAALVLARGLEWSRSLPGMIRDVEHHLIRPVKFGLVESLRTLGPFRETFGAELFELLGCRIDVLHQHAEMVDAAEVEAMALVPAEMQDGEIQRAIAEKHTI